ncbi:uncharacterized protein TrAFT101_010108 [Trichoderma asperellum]|uniref:uncharacterized protein n=1 Tax=Trichoderma asperellum TaxID=101201 RepID=UPI003319266A|nr:hypothetical protein TrAFT101_010108 [Trichoderma asperellum]
MNQSDKRRGGGRSSSNGPAWRTGPATHTSRHSTHTIGGGAGASAGNSSGGNNSDTMPLMPPRAAMVSTNSAGGDDSHNGSPILDRKRKEKARDKSNSSSSTARGSSPHGVSSTGINSGGSGSPISKQQLRRQQQQQQQSDSASTSLLREKDERIAYLENEMGIMEREFHQELDRLSQTESETATFWQGKHSALNQQYLRTDTELRLLRAEVDVREAEREELRQGVEVLRRELQEKDDEIRRLRGQVRGLKDFVSTSTRTDDQTSDEVFGDGMTKLGNGLQNWVITNFRKAKLADLSQASDATLTELGQLVPMYEELIHTSKVHLLQSIVSSILVEMVFNAYYVGLSEEDTQHFQQMEQLLTSFCSSTDPVNQWRSSTLALLRREAHHLHDNTDTFAEAVISRITQLLDSIITSPPPPASASIPPASTSTSTSPSTARGSALRVLVKNSIELARLLVVQKARLRVYMPSILPHQQVLFEPDTMEDIGGEEDEENLASREINCVVFPGVIKHGDENGGHMQYRNVIVKARVLCSPEE